MCSTEWIENTISSAHAPAPMNHALRCLSKTQREQQKHYLLLSSLSLSTPRDGAVIRCHYSA